MSDLLPIEQVTDEDVREIVREALSQDLKPDCIADFVARVDWSGVDREQPPIARALGALEAWSTEYAEGDLPSDEYRLRLNKLHGHQPRVLRDRD